MNAGTAARGLRACLSATSGDEGLVPGGPSLVSGSPSLYGPGRDARRLLQTQPAKGHGHDLGKRAVDATRVIDAVDVPAAPSVPGGQHAAVRLVHESAQIGNVSASPHRTSMRPSSPFELGGWKSITSTHAVAWRKLLPRFIRSLGSSSRNGSSITRRVAWAGNVLGGRWSGSASRIRCEWPCGSNPSVPGISRETTAR
jgi:hypothetical protein